MLSALVFNKRPLASRIKETDHLVEVGAVRLTFLDQRAYRAVSQRRSNHPVTRIKIDVDTTLVMADKAAPAQHVENFPGLGHLA